MNTSVDQSSSPERSDRPDPRILLVDCDMFYVQVARLEDPEGAGQEEMLIVGGSPTGRGVVTSASYPVRAFGVHSGMPTSQALRLCPHARVVPVSRKACSRRSRRVHEVLMELSPVVQAASIDEFYLDLSGTQRLFHGEPLEVSAQRIRTRILEDADISVSVGGGTRKLIAKLAAGRAKPGGVVVVSPGEEQAFMETFELREIPGIGPAFAQALERKGLRGVSDVLPVERGWLEKWFGPSRTRWLWSRVRGEDHSRVTPGEARKSVSTERTFSHDLDDDGDLERELLRLVHALGSSLRGKRLRGRTITVKIRDDDFRTRQASHSLPDPVQTDPAIYSVARGLLRELRRRRRRGVRLLGIGISSLEEGDGPPQLELFPSKAQGDTSQQQVVARVLDDLRERFGDDAVLPGTILERSDSGGGK